MSVVGQRGNHDVFWPPASLSARALDVVNPPPPGLQQDPGIDMLQESAEWAAKLKECEGVCSGVDNVLKDFGGKVDEWAARLKDVATPGGVLGIGSRSGDEKIASWQALNGFVKSSGS